MLNETWNTTFLWKTFKILASTHWVLVIPHIHPQSGTYLPRATLTHSRRIPWLACRPGIWLFSNNQTCLVVNWPRKWAVFDFWKKSKISQNGLQKSITEKKYFLISSRVKSFVGSSPSFSTPNFLSGAYGNHFRLLTFCRGVLERVAILWSLSTMNWIFLIICNKKWDTSTS